MHVRSNLGTMDVDMPPPPVTRALQSKVEKRLKKQAKEEKAKEQKKELDFKMSKFFGEPVNFADFNMNKTNLRKQKKVKKNIEQEYQQFGGEQTKEEKEADLAAGYITLWVQVRAGTLTNRVFVLLGTAVPTADPHGQGGKRWHTVCLIGYCRARQPREVWEHPHPMVF